VRSRPTWAREARPSSGRAVLVTGESTPCCLAVDATYVYWATESINGGFGQIRRMPKAGGPVATIADAQTCPRALVIDASYLYWYNGCSTGQLRRAPLGGGAVFDYSIAVDLPSEDARVLAADSRNLYFNNYGVLGIPKAGGAQFNVDDVDYVDGLAVDDRGIYWVGPLEPGVTSAAVSAYPAGASAPTRLVTETPLLRTGIALDTTWVYFADEGLRRVARTGGAVETLVPAAPESWRMAVDDVSLYWIEEYATAGPYWVKKIPKGGGSPTLVATTKELAYSLALDADCVYWTDAQAGMIEAAAK
jgi:hypothetical protein